MAEVDIVPPKPIESIIATELSVTPQQIRAAIRLMDKGATVPFIARYRKEATGGLSDVHLRMLSERLEYIRDLERRRIDVLESIEKQGKLIPQLKSSIEHAQTKSELEDLYLPFRLKRRSLAQAARDSGLEPLANLLFQDPTQDPETCAYRFVNPVKNVLSPTQALNGARNILIERFAEDAVLLGKLREHFWKTGWVLSKAANAKTDAQSKFADYFNFREPVADIPSHRILALLRGRREKVLKVTLETSGYKDYADNADTVGVEFISMIALHFNIYNQNRSADKWLHDTVKQAWTHRIRVYLELDIMRKLSQEADEVAIKVFAQNLHSLLLQAPAGPRPTLALDPGLRTGVKVVCIDATGKVLKYVTIFPHVPQNEWELSQEILKLLIQQYHIELIAIGNGTASRETDRLVISVMQQLNDPKLQKLVVSEAGASVYSASNLASQELPDLDVTIRGAVSIARRLQDPLAELVKIEPKSIGVGQYQHDVNQAKLSRSLRNVVEDCVNAVGVDVNTASPELLSYVSGLNVLSAASIVEYRNKHGLFKNRLELKNIPDFGPRTFEQAAGFLRIHNGDNPLDQSGVHPESYELIERILRHTQTTLETLLGNTQALRSVKAQVLVDDKFGEPTVLDILQELEKPGRDPRPEFKTASFKDNVESIKDLKVGMKLQGVVTNVANFGAFVDIGVHQDGLIHISELSDEFIEDPHTVIKTGEIVHVKVVEIDVARNRIALSRKKRSNLRNQPR